jgi:hypothetical protein
VIDSGLTRHAGIVWLPTQLDDEQRIGFADFAAGLIKFHVREDGPHTWRGFVLYPTQDGPTWFDGKGEVLLMSWDAMIAGPPA